MSPAIAVPGRSGQPYVDVEIRGGVAVCVPNDLGLMTPFVLIEQEDWFEDEIRFVRRMLAPGMNVVDVGASYGVYALTAARIVGPAGRVWAFEPSAGTAGCLRRSIEQNRFDNIEVIQAGLSDSPGRARLVVYPNTEIGYVTEDAAVRGEHEEIALQTLDACMAERGWAGIDFLKIDAEGYEERVIAGGTRFFRTASPLIMYEVRAGNKLNLAMLDAFDALGYRNYRLVPGLGALAPFRKSDPVDPHQLNAFSCKPERAAALAGRGLLIEEGSPERIEEPPPGAWPGYLQARPYARGLLDTWRYFARSQASQRDWQIYESVLNGYAQAHDPGHPLPDRHRQLLRARAQLKKLLERHATVARLMTFSRIATELGNRAEAVQALQFIVGNLFPSVPTGLNEPFLALTASLEETEPGANIVEWLKGAVRAQHERLTTYSSYFCNQDSMARSLATLEEIRCSPFWSPELERRRQLLRLLAGMQTAFEPEGVLSQRTTDNLNPALWTAGRG